MKEFQAPVMFHDGFLEFPFRVEVAIRVRSERRRDGRVRAVFRHRTYILPGGSGRKFDHIINRPRTVKKRWKCFRSVS